ncbi:MAG: sucrose phosphorylase [Chloroflexi bacterium]|nr:MAG: sucrose phosphorylase [Chloroflexota bacterium]MBL1193771.1 sucrose phosphorylase [Chloroflexota bacterium]NOH11064.1 sucrose phosphorylase [Chloroflexota bacterium]
MTVKNKVQLITYPDSLGGNLQTLNGVLKKHFLDIFQGGIHILPPFPSSGDRGFAPLTYLEIEPSFGNWEDIRAIGEDHDILLDLMVNHISQKSSYFQDFLKLGAKSEYADIFLTMDKVSPNSPPSQEDIEKLFLRRTEPFSTFTIKDTGEQETVWTTFGKVTPSEQIDLDIHSETTRQLLTEFFENFARNQVKIVRLDAVGYVIKKLGTSSFFVEPEIFDFLGWISEMATSLNIELLPEVHAHYTTQFKLAERGYWIYDFILPYVILEALINQQSARLLKYLRMRPHKQFTMLDCHDGIPIKPDLDDLVSTEDAQKIVDICLERGANLSLIFSPKHRGRDGFDVHQIRCSYYSMLECNDDAYLAARAIQFFTPGVPQVYYVGLLAGQNDQENVERTGEGREINRHNFTIEEINEAVDKDAVQRLLKLIQFRNDHPAFDGEFEAVDSDKQKVDLRWRNGQAFCQLKVNLKDFKTFISYNTDHGEIREYPV